MQNSKSLTFVSLLLVSLLLVVASTSSAQTIVTQTKETFSSRAEPLVNEDGSTLELARGVWRARGYGYLASIKQDEVLIYNEAESLLWAQNDVDPKYLQIAISDNGKQARISPSPEIPPFVVDRIPQMPNKTVPDKWTPAKLFDAFAETMTREYVFFEERSFDWPKRLENIQPKVNDDMSESDLFDAMVESLEGLDDAHVQLGATIDGEPRRAEIGMPLPLKEGMKLFQQQNEFDDFQEYLGSRVQALEAGIGEVILKGEPNQFANQFTWGVTGDNVGYLHIDGMSGFADTESPEEELAELHKAMHSIITKLSDTRAMIVDVSTNGGGSDEFSRAIASHFADQRRLAFTKGPRRAPDTLHSIYVEPFKQNGKSVTYTKPVYLVVSNITVSAAEIFVLCMKDLPHVTTVGTPTRGALSDVLSKTLPNGWAYGLSNEIYRDSKGVCFEAIGIKPKVEMLIIDPKKPDLGHAAAIARVVELAD